MTEPSTLNSITRWVNEVRQSIPECVFILVGNKSDREADRLVTREEAMSFAERESIQMVIETSAYTNQMIEQAFGQLIEDVYEEIFKNRPECQKTPRKASSAKTTNL